MWKPCLLDVVYNDVSMTYTSLAVDATLIKEERLAAGDLATGGVLGGVAELPSPSPRL